MTWAMPRASLRSVLLRTALKAAFKKALNAAKPDSLKNLETALGSSLGRDQADAGESHLRGGEVGKWTSQLSRISALIMSSLTIPFSRHSRNRPKKKFSWFGSGWGL